MRRGRRIAAGTAAAAAVAGLSLGLIWHHFPDRLSPWSVGEAYAYAFPDPPSLRLAPSHAAAAVPDGRIELAALLRPTSWIDDPFNDGNIWPETTPNKYDYPVRNLTVRLGRAQRWETGSKSLSTDAEAYQLPLPAKLSAFPQSITPDRLIVGINAYRVDELLTNNEFLGKRGISVHAFFADVPESRRTVWDARTILPSHINLHYRGHESGAKKWLQMIEFLDELASPSVEWIVICDSDVLLYRRNLLSILDHFNSSELLCLGAPSDQTHANDLFGHDTAFGGGGVVISRTLAKRLVPYIKPCMEKHPDWVGGDMLLKLCARAFLGVNNTLVPFFRQCDIACTVELYEHSYMVASQHRPDRKLLGNPHAANTSGIHQAWMKADVADVAGDKWLRRFAWRSEETGKTMVLTNGLSLVVYDKPTDGQELDLENIEVAGEDKRKTYWMPTIEPQPSKRYIWTGQLWGGGKVVGDAFESVDGKWAVVFCEKEAVSWSSDRLDLRFGVSMAEDPVLRLCSP